MGVNLYGDDPSKPPGQGPGQDSRARPDFYDYFIGARLCGVYDFSIIAASLRKCWPRDFLARIPVT